MSPTYGKDLSFHNPPTAKLVNVVGAALPVIQFITVPPTVVND